MLDFEVFWWFWVLFFFLLFLLLLFVLLLCYILDCLELGLYGEEGLDLLWDCEEELIVLIFLFVSVFLKIFFIFGFVFRFVFDVVLIILVLLWFRFWEIGVVWWVELWLCCYVDVVSSKLSWINYWDFLICVGFNGLGCEDVVRVWVLFFLLRIGVVFDC